jgi:hypothetical protein
MNPRLNPMFVTIAATIAVQVLMSVGITQAGPAPDKKVKQPGYTEFSNPEMVQILGYNDNEGNSNDAMEPFISRDGNYLFFNNSNSAPTTSLFWATRIDDVTFQYQGEIGGEVNSSGPLDAVPSMDMNGNFYFITNRSYAVDLSTIYSGLFADVSDVASVTPVNPVAGVAAPKIGLVNFDSEISADGNTLYFTRGNYSNLAPGAPPSSTEMMVATNQGGTFVIDPHSAKIMKMINDEHLNYAPDTSADELEFFFTRTIPKPPTPEFGIYMATRSSTSKPFDKPKKIEAITGYAEGPSISPDNLSLYYHWKNASGVFVINRVTRTLKP